MGGAEIQTAHILTSGIEMVSVQMNEMCERGMADLDSSALI